LSDNVELHFYIIVILTFSAVFFRIQATIFDREGRFMTDGNTIRSVAKAMELLQLLSDAGEAMTLTAISERAGLPKSTVFGLLTTMRDYDVITQHADGKYALGLRLFEYGCRASAFWNISSLARPYLEHLAEATGASAIRI